MSRIYFVSPDHESEVRGAERAHAGMLCHNLAYGLVAHHTRNDALDGHPFEAILPPGERLRDPTGWDRSNPAMRRYLDLIAVETRLHLMGEQQSLWFDGQRHPTKETVLNTAIVAGSDPVAFLARLDGSCESHLWVEEGRREWLADIIELGRKDNILRPAVGWKHVIEHLREIDTHPGPVVTWYSVSDGFPYLPDRHVAEFGETTAESWWEAKTDEQRWTIAIADLMLRSETQWWLRLEPHNLREPAYGTLATLFDAMVSPEWTKATGTEWLLREKTGN